MRVLGEEIKVTGNLMRIGRLDADKFQFLEEDPDALLQALRNCGTRIDLFTFIQRLPFTEQRFNYPMEWDNFAAIPLTTFENWWTKQIGFKARNKAKQAEKKGVQIREAPFSDELAEGIWKIYNECPVRQGRKFPHYGKSLQRIYEDEATYLNTSFFIGAFLETRLIGFIKVVVDKSGTQAGLMNIVSLISERDKAPTNGLIVQAVRSCTARGVSFLTYSNFSYGKKQRDSLSDFKERNAFQRINVPRYYVPLTWLGHAGLRLGLHHRMADRIPESLAEKLRELRQAWLDRRFPAAPEVSE